MSSAIASPGYLANLFLGLVYQEAATILTGRFSGTPGKLVPATRVEIRNVLIRYRPQSGITIGARVPGVLAAKRTGHIRRTTRNQQNQQN